MSLISLSDYRSQSPVIETPPVEGVVRQPGVRDETFQRQEPLAALMKQRPTPTQRPYPAETPGQPGSGGAFYTTSGTSAEIIPAEFYNRGMIIDTWI